MKCHDNWGRGGEERYHATTKHDGRQKNMFLSNYYAKVCLI